MNKGRGTKYKKSYCDRIRAFLSKGNSLAAFAWEIKVSVRTLHRWFKRYPEFDEAYRIGEAGAQAHFERLQKMFYSGLHVSPKLNKDGAYWAKGNVKQIEFIMQRRFQDYQNPSYNNLRKPEEEAKEAPKKIVYISKIDSDGMITNEVEERS